MNRTFKLPHSQLKTYSYNQRYNMKLSVLYEDTQRQEPTLNILTSPEEDIKTAFDLLEHEGFYDYSKNEKDSYSIGSWLKMYAEKKASETGSQAEIERVEKGGQTDNPKIYEDEGMSHQEILDELKESHRDYYGPDSSLPITIYGDGGWNRYFIRYGGGIWFSAGHATSDQSIRDAADLGFGIFQ
jgi:hypothetical protein